MVKIIVRQGKQEKYTHKKNKKILKAIICQIYANKLKNHNKIDDFILKWI